jgi:hypothetical protein
VEEENGGASGDFLLVTGEFGDLVREEFGGSGGVVGVEVA